MGPFAIMVLLALIFIGVGKKTWASTGNGLVRSIAAILYAVGLWFMLSAFIGALQQMIFPLLNTGAQPTSTLRAPQAYSTSTAAGLFATTPTNFVPPPTTIKAPVGTPTIGTQRMRLDVVGQRALNATNLDGGLLGGPTRVFELQMQGVDWEQGFISSAAWTAEGKTILVASSNQSMTDSGTAPEFYSVFHTISRLQIVSVDRSTPRAIIQTDYTTKLVSDIGNCQPGLGISDGIWSAEGQRVALSYSDEAANRCPVVMNADGSGLRKLTNCEADDHPRYWSVDGKWIVVWSERSPALYAYEVDGSRRVQLSQLGKMPVYDERYFPWRVLDSPVCKGGTGFWSCE